MASKERKALGAGLDVLFGDAFEESSPESQSTLPIEKIEPRLSQPREYFDEEALMTLSESIKKYGLIQPITVRLLDSGYYQIIAGERRWRASKLAGLSEVPVRIIEADDRTTAELALVENLQREDLNPIEEAKGYRTLINEFGLTQEEAARSVGRSRPAVANSLRLLSLCPGVADMVEKGSLSAGHARALVAIESPDLQLDAAKTVISKNLSVRKTEALASKIISTGKLSAEKKTGEKGDSKDSEYSELVALELTRHLGRKVRLTGSGSKGTLELEFYNAEDRENLISQLKNIK